MTKILDRLPVFLQPRTVTFGQRSVRIRRDELLVWLGISLPGEQRAERVSPPFPALLDTANNSECYLHEHHLVHWAGIRPDLLAVLGSKRINQQKTPCRQAGVWIYPNQPGTTDVWKGRPPFHLEVPDGIAVAPLLPDKPVAPRLPLLGLPALRKNALDFWFDSAAAHCYLRTADWRSKLIRLLQRP
jgi:hypothetical protein